MSQTRDLADEQAALRRLAMLVADRAAPAAVFAAVIEEVGQLLPVDVAILGRFHGDGTGTVLAAWGGSATSFAPGSRWKLEGNNLATAVYETGHTVRNDRYDDASGAIGVAADESGFRSGIGTPITVEGSLWGVIVVGSTLEQPLPADTEARLGSFTELVATAIANADGRAEISRLAEEQAALRRVATLVASGTPPEELFAAVVEEIARLLPVEFVHMGRYESDRTMTIVAPRGSRDERFALGSRWPLTGRNLATLVFEGGRATRIDDYGDASGPVGVAAHEIGLRSVVGSPIVVDGRVWGLTACSSRRELLPADTEERLGSFTALVATAIANAESRAEISRLAEEQAALRRVATLVARGTPPEELFAAVTEEVGRLLPVDFVHMGRYEANGTVTVLATSGSTVDRFPVGATLSRGGRNLTTIVFETGRPGRIDSYGDTTGPFGDTGRGLGIRSSAGTPIIVDGRVWGVVTAGSTTARALPPNIEARLSDFTALVATAIANAESRGALTASRARIVAAADESRRRIERDLHDGGQQRLVHAVIVLKLALRALSNGDANATELVAEALQHAEQANAELRELAHGILPAALTRGGLKAGVDALVSRIALPVTVDVDVKHLPGGVEATAYFVISEALTNAVKHAHASSAAVTASVDAGQLRVEVRDDGVGGALGGHGTGLGGLADRVSALDGRLVLDSPAGGGTHVCALLPIGSPSGEARRPGT
ncbi:MAG TPA: GAF domain-containing protein [Solirubrobacteraceae bacterium]|jgi:GAF domain-containing protein|nr:GAF domain-containing protein [Solirubrobacteraceae bacterium]